MIAEVSAIVARGMGIRRGGRWLLRPAAFGIAPGVVGLAGPPGAGKTTLLATFATLRRPHVGALEILGYDTGNNSGLRAVRSRIGYLPGGPAGQGFDGRDRRGTVRDQVAYAAYFRRAGREAVAGVLARLDLADVADREPRRLPPDLRVRAGLAAACVHGPDLLLLDEPFAGVEESRATELRALLPALAPTVLVAVRDPEGLRCDRLFMLAEGVLEEPGQAPRPRQAGWRMPARSLACG